MLAAPNQIGSEIQCTDCHSTVKVTAESSEPALGKPVSQPKSKSPAAPADQALNAFPELGAGRTPPPPPADDYALAPLSAELLRPRVPVEPEPPAETATSQPRRVPSAAAPRGGAASGEASSRPRNQPSAQTLQPSGQPDPQKAATAPRSEYDHRLSDSIEAYEQQIREHHLDDGPVDEANLFRFPDQFLAPFRDTSVWIYVLVLTLIAWGNLALNELAFYLMSVTTNGVPIYSSIGLILAIFSFAIALLGSVVSGVVINQLVEAAIHRRNVFHPPEMGIIPWFNSFLVVGVSLWASMLVGIVFGFVLGGLFQSTLVRWLVTAAVAFLLLPVGILSAYYNGSPLKVFSPVVVGTIRSHRERWLQFYRWMGTWFGLLAVGALVGLVPVLGMPLRALLESVVVVLVGRTIGLLAQVFLTNWLDDDQAGG